MKYRKISIKFNGYISQPCKYKNLYFHSNENTRFDIFTREKPKDWNYFFLFSQYGLREATLYDIYVSFLRETTIGVSYFYGNVNKKSESLRRNSSATTRKSKQKLM